MYGIFGKAMFSVKCVWMKPGCLKTMSVCVSAHHHVTTSTWNDIYFKLTSPLRCLSLRFTGLVCMRQVSQSRGRNVFSLFERCVTAHWRVTSDTTITGLSLTCLNHATWNPSHAKTCSVSTPCMVGLVYRGWPHLRPKPCPTHVNNIVFVTFNFESVHFVTDLALFLSANASFFFCFLLGDEESCPFSSNKQTTVWINKLKGSGCGPVTTVCSVRLSVCLSCKWARGAPRPNCIGSKPAHYGPRHERICESCATPASL